MNTNLKIQHKYPWIKKVPNLLCYFRLAIIPIIVILYPYDVEYREFCGFLFGLASASDFFDGYIARAFDASTKLGAILDQISDKILTSVALILLVYSHDLYVWIASLFIVRELAISGIRHFASQNHVEINVSSVGKWKTFILSVGITCLIVNKQVWGLPWIEFGWICVSVSLFLSMYSAYQYMQAFWKNFNFNT